MGCTKSAHLLLTVVMLIPTLLFADTVIGPEAIPSTENAVFMSNGRYFVAGQNGIFEIKKTTVEDANCLIDPDTGMSYCKLVDPSIDSGGCFFSGLTGDDTYLYAACTVYPSTSPLDALGPPARAALLRILPGDNGVDDITMSYFNSPAWYNGMAMMEDGSILLSKSDFNLLSRPSAAIVKLTIQDQQSLNFTLSDWLPGSYNYLLPNGIRVDRGYVYFVGGQNLFRIRIRSDGTAGVPILIHQVGLLQVMDDFDIAGDKLAVASWSILLGGSSILLVDKRGSGDAIKIDTGNVQLSSVQVDPGVFGPAGSFMGTSFNQGGVYSFSR